MCMSPPALHEPGLVVHTCNSKTQELEAGESEIQEHIELHNESEASLGYMKPCLKQAKI